MAHGISRTELDSALARWQQAQVISADQAERIRKMEHTAPDVLPREPAQVLAWLGGFLAIVASAVFIGVDWNSMGGAQQTMWATIAIAGLWAIAWVLRRNGDPIRVQASNLLVIAGTGVIMLWFYAFYRLTGMWPEHPDRPGSTDTTRDLMGVAQAVTAIVAAFWAFRLRASWMILPAGFVGWMAWIAWMDRFGTPNTMETDRDILRLALYGVLLVVAGFALTRFGWKHHAMWLFIVGLTINLIMLGIRSFEDPTGLNGLVFLAMTLVAIALGIGSDLRIFLVYGAVGLYGWLSALVIETFGGSRPVAFALILLGVAIVAVSAVWQRFHTPDGIVHSH